MIETFYIIIAMMITPMYPNSDIYIISDPTFMSSEQCVQFVGIEQQGLVNKARNEFYGRNVDNIYCMEEKELKKLLTYMKKPGEQI